MKLIRKILKYTALALIAIVIILYLVSIVFETKISGIFIGELNRNISTEVSTGSLNFSLLKRFPRASVELENFLVESPRPYDAQEDEYFPDTLLYADKIIFTLKIAPLIRKNYTVDRIDIDRALINICKGPSGIMNTQIWKEKESSDTSSMTLNINNVNINNSSFTYSSPGTGFLLEFLIDNSSNRISMEDPATWIKSKSNTVVTNLVTGSKYKLEGSYPLKFNTGLALCDDTIRIDRASLDINGIPAEGDCIITKTGKKISLSLESRNSDIELLTDILLPGSKDFIDKYDIRGSLSSGLEIKGSYDKNYPLVISAVLDLEKGEASFSSRAFSFDDLAAAAHLQMTTGKGKGDFEISTDRFTGKLNGTDISGSFRMKGLDMPYIDIMASGLFASDKLATLLEQYNIESTDGSVRLNARLRGRIPLQAGDKEFNILELRRSINLGLNGLTLSVPQLDGEITNLYGNIMIADNIWFDEVSMNYNDQNIALKGLVTGFNDWILNKDTSLYIIAGLWSDKIDVASFRNKFNGGGRKTGSHITSPDINLNISCDSIIIGKLRASLFEGSLSYVSGLTDISSFSMNALGGTLSGNAAISRLSEGSYAMRGWFDIGNIDINDTFSSFNNFNQDYIVSDNIEGFLTGNISISATADSNFRINRKDLVLNGEYRILNGKLLDFEPAYKLSRFIEIDELAEIEFSELENELVINDEMITIPKMDISSSAFNISLAGTHAFDGTYEYHLRVLLSDLLSRKKNPKLSEFGIVEDDGLGKTSIYLMISGDKTGSRVTHDTGALRAGLREDLQKEKQSIKSILNEEYGWYTGDSTLTDRTSYGNRRFRITWEEADSIRTESADTVEKKLPLFKLFKKKNDN